mgnify:CR=1 FL=1
MFKTTLKLAAAALLTEMNDLLNGALAASRMAEGAADVGFVTCDPGKVLGPDTCVKCHAGEVQQWRATPHFATFDALHGGWMEVAARLRAQRREIG